ncbi:hypothetical protein HPP05_07800 [Corallococcus exiguus]|uniref:phosphatase domain-containing protein n=1 Tax=Corallococcus exiguus TaxID=83462 RepID=UPI001494B310|nr:tyrosine-protein phosphatase [Corallococcus exiguus]NPC69649.1 hypothetical protein [Corallococcus exiguus]
MKYTFVFTTAAALLTFLAQRIQGFGWLLLWPALSFAVVALAYAGPGARAFGKRPDGRMRPWAVFALLPYLLLTWGTWHLARRSSRERAFDEVVPGVLVGRRLLPGELPSGVTAVLDLTSEFIEPEAIRASCRYVSLPILDASTLPVEHVVPILRELAALPGSLYVHCAQGHGRTGMIAAALLVARGDAPDAKAALARVRQARPGVQLSALQERALDALSAALRPGGV